MKNRLHSLLLSPLLVLVAACSTETAPTAADASTGADITGDVLVSGTFSGRNDHVVTGGVELLVQDGVAYLRLGADFSLDGAPDPRIGFGRSGEYDTTTTFSELTSTTGEQTYRLPDGFELGSLNEATIWCGDFSVPLGTAPLH